jgi:hypothetical protein
MRTSANPPRTARPARVLESPETRPMARLLPAPRMPALTEIAIKRVRKSSHQGIYELGEGDGVVMRLINRGKPGGRAAMTAIVSGLPTREIRTKFNQHKGLCRY